MKIERKGFVPRTTEVRPERVVLGTTGVSRVVIPAFEKTNSRLSPYCVPNEHICAEIGRYLRLPIVPGAVTLERGSIPKFWYSTLELGNELPLPPVDPVECIARLPKQCTGIVLFDILIANCDRTVSNMFIDRSSDPPELRLFNHPDDIVNSPWIERIENLPDYLIEETCHDAIDFGLTQEEVATVTEFLKKRRHQLGHLVTKHGNKLRRNR